jgi:EpsI family protein
MQSPLVEAHLTLGWAIFAVGLVAFFPAARRIERSERRRRDALQAADGSAQSEPDHPSVTPARTRRISAPALATLTAGLGPLIYYGGSFAPARQTPRLELAVPSAWRPVSSGAGAQWTPGFSGAEEHTAQAWSDGERTVAVNRLLYRRQAQGAELIGYGNRIAADSVLVLERVIGPVGERRHYANEAVVRDRDGFRLVWYWYRVGGSETESAARAKLLELWAFVRWSRDSELIALSTPCQGNSCAEASRTLAEFQMSP